MPIGIVNTEDFDAEMANLGITPNPLVIVPDTIPESSTPTVEPTVLPLTETLKEFKPHELGSMVRTIERGRGLHSVQVPEALRAVIASDAIENSSRSAKSIARAFDVSDSSLSAYKHGANSTASYDNPDVELKAKTNHTRMRIGNKARSRLLSTLNHITPDKLENAKLRDLAATAQAMSAVIRNIEPPAADVGNNVNIVLFAPRVHTEAHYETLVIP